MQEKKDKKGRKKNPTEIKDGQSAGTIIYLEAAGWNGVKYILIANYGF